MKILSLSPSLTDILRLLNVSTEDISAVTSLCPEDFPETVARVGSPKALEIPKILSLQADVVLGVACENRPEQIRAIEKKFAVTLFDVRSLEHVKDTIHTLGRLTNKMAEAEAFIQKLREAEKENQKRLGEFPPIKTLILLWNQPYLTVNFDTYISRLVEACGCVNVFRAEPTFEIPLDLEDLIEKNPELLLLPSAPYPFKKRHLAGFRQYRGFSKIPIELIDGNLFSCFGPRSLEALKILGQMALKVKACGAV